MLSRIALIVPLMAINLTTPVYAQADCEDWITEDFFFNATFSISDVRRCLKAGADPNARDSQHSVAPLHFVAILGNSEAVTLLLDAGADVNARGYNGFTPLHAAVVTGRDIEKSSEAVEAVILALLDAGANINARTKDGFTPLHFALGETGQLREIYEPDEAAILALLDAGANVNARTEEGFTPLDLAFQKVLHNDKLKYTDAYWRLYMNSGCPIPDIVYSNEPFNERYLELYEYALEFYERAKTVDIQGCLDAGADVNARSGYGTTMHYVAWKSTAEAVDALLNAGADPNARDDSGATPLHWANTHTIAALLNAGADPNARDDSGATPLHWKAASDAPEAVNALLDAGADPKTQSNDGEMPWDLMQSNEDLTGTDAYWRLHDARFE